MTETWIETINDMVLTGHCDIEEYQSVIETYIRLELNEYITL